MKTLKRFSGALWLIAGIALAGSVSVYAATSIGDSISVTSNISAGGALTISGSGTSTFAGGVSAAGLASSNGLTISGGNFSVTGNASIASTDSSVAPLYVAGKSSSAVVGTVSVGTLRGVVVRGNYAYGNRNTDESLVITDISNPSSPTVVSTYTVGGSTCAGSKVAVAGRYAYFTSVCGGTLRIFDISDAKNPKQLGSINSLAFPTALVLDQQGKYAYTGGDQLHIIDVSDASNPQRVILKTTSQITSGNYIGGLALSGRYLYLLTEVNTASTPNFWVMDVADPSNPIVKGSLTINDTISDQQGAAIIVRGRYAYLAGDSKIWTVDISDATGPSVVGSVTRTDAPNAYLWLQIQGRYAYVAQSNGLAVYDISNVSSPSYVGLLSSSNIASVGIAGRYAFTSVGEVIDLGGAYIQQLEAGGIMADSLNVRQTARFQNIDVAGGLSVGMPGIYSSGPVGIASEGGGPDVLSVTAATGNAATGKTISFNALTVTNKATSSTASITKTGLKITSTGTWNGSASSNIGLLVSSVTGGSTNYDAIFNGGGGVGIGTSSPAFGFSVASSTYIHNGSTQADLKVNNGAICADNNGNAKCTASLTAGVVYGDSSSFGASDVAENYLVKQGEFIEPGNLVSLSPEGTIQQATNQTTLLGAISTAPGVLLGDALTATSTQKSPVVLVGRTPVTVSLANGSISVGDRIAVSSEPGVGMKASGSGQTVGIALEPFDGNSDHGFSRTGQIMVFINLGYAVLDSPTAELAQSSPSAPIPPPSDSSIWSIDQSSGKISTSYILDMSDHDLINVRSILSAAGTWSIDENGKLIVKEIEADKIKTNELKTNELRIGTSDNPTGINIYDQDTKSPYCIRLRSGALVQSGGECGSVEQTPAATTTQ